MDTAIELPPPRLLGRYAYPTGHRVIEIVAVVLFHGFGVVFAWRTGAALVADADPMTLALAGAAVLAALIAADFLSGLVHAVCDNLGSVDTPVVGQKFIRSFREHHVDPLDMTRGDFIRVNADNHLACLPILIPAVLWMDVTSHLFLAPFLLALLVFVVLTNQIHKWAHTAEVPGAVRWLQHRKVVLAPEHHRVHHTFPYDSHYCITSGVTNPFLTRIGFWPALVRVCRWLGRFVSGSPASGHPSDV
ncbi:MAG: carotenoid synthesis regulator CarF [Acidimicrobiales bacterium]|nr:carotenoid synthesis regulator CarF [Acidimicrobiales bacterium]